MSVARVWALPGLGGMGGLRAEFAAGTETPHPSHRKKQALPAVHPNSKPCIPAELGPWSRAAQTFIRWAPLGVWERLLLLAQERGVQLGMTFLDGTSIRAHHKAAGAEKGGHQQGSR